MRVAVTAASGRLGHAVIRELTREAGADQVVAVARSPDRMQCAGIEKRAGDYGSLESMTTALRGVHSVVMISAPVVAGTDRLALHRKVIEAARRAGVRSVLYTSVVGSPAAQATFFGPFWQLNRQTEAELRESGVPWIVARNGLYLELDLRHIMAAAAGDGVYTNSGGEGRAPYITIDEIAHACAQLALNPDRCGRIYNITGECLAQGQIVALAGEVFGVDVGYRAISDEACIEKFLRLMPERGEAVARMLTGCFQCMRVGAFEVASDYLAAAGRPVKSVRAMMGDCREKFAQN